MNFLKLKTILFSLMAITMVTVFLTSCESETIVPKQESLVNFVDNEDGSLLLNPPTSDSNSQILIPKGLNDQDMDKVLEYLGNLTDEDKEVLRENNRIGEFLKSIDMYDAVYASLEDGAIFNNINLEEWLTEEQIVELQTYESNSILKMRGVYWDLCYWGPSPLCISGNFLLYIEYDATLHIPNGKVAFLCHFGDHTSPWTIENWGITDRRYCNQ